MSTASQLPPRRSVRLAVFLASCGVVLCFVAAFGLVEQPVNAETSTEAARITD